VSATCPWTPCPRTTASPFCLGTAPATRFAERKHQTLRGLFASLRARGHITVSPLREPGPRVGRTFQPYIFSREQIRRLLDATAILADRRSPMQAQTFRIAEGRRNSGAPQP